jgi:hypothetical protein
MNSLEHNEDVYVLERGVAAQLKQGGWRENAQRHEKEAEAYEIRELTQAYGRHANDP